MRVSEYIHQITPLTTEEKTEVEDAFTEATLRKGDFFAQEGKICRQLAFLLSGRLRNYYHDENAVEKTCYFAPANTFITAYTSFITSVPSFENIEAIEESRLTVISKPALEALSDSIPKLHVFRRIMSENMYISKPGFVFSKQGHAHRRTESWFGNPNQLSIGINQATIAAAMLTNIITFRNHLSHGFT